MRFQDIVESAAFLTALAQQGFACGGGGSRCYSRRFVACNSMLK
jgi:hypothetical protein